MEVLWQTNDLDNFVQSLAQKKDPDFYFKNVYLVHRIFENPEHINFRAILISHFQLFIQYSSDLFFFTFRLFV